MVNWRRRRFRNKYNRLSPTCAQKARPRQFFHGSYRPLPEKQRMCGSPPAQPRNLVGGHVLSAIVGVAAYQILGQMPWLAAAIAVSTAIALMHLTKTLHPPGGATALIAVIGGDAVHNLGFLYAVIPAAFGGRGHAGHRASRQQYTQQQALP
jgi:hypothetical protein